MLATAARLGGAMAGEPKQQDGCTIAIVVIGLLLLFSLMSRCDRKADPGSTTNVAQPFGAASLGNSISEITPEATVKPLDRAGVARGTAHLRLAMKAEGLSGAMVYSQNCYDALSRSFEWAKLDSCGAFDLAAVNAADTADISELSSEAQYFASEAAAARYLAAATKAGENSAEADKRLDELQKRIGRTPLPRPADPTAISNLIPPADADEPEAGPSDEEQPDAEPARV